MLSYETKLKLAKYGVYLSFIALIVIMLYLVPIGSQEDIVPKEKNVCMQQVGANCPENGTCTVIMREVECNNS